jgi:hypothetical protein
MSTKHAARYASQPNLAGLSTLPLGQVPRQPFAATVTGGLANAAQQQRPNPATQLQNPDPTMADEQGILAALRWPRPASRGSACA